MRISFIVALWLHTGVVFAQLPRGETAESMGNGDALGALWIFAAIAIFAAFKESRQNGLKVLSFFAALGVVYAIAPTLGSVLVGLLVVVVGVSYFNKMW